MTRRQKILTRAQERRIGAMALAKWRQSDHTPYQEVVRQALRTVLDVKVNSLPPEKLRQNQRAYFAALEIVAKARRVHLNKRLRENIGVLRLTMRAS